MSERCFSHLTWKNRLKIERMLRDGHKPLEIAGALHVHNTTIYREIKRGMTKQLTSELEEVMVYCADTAQRKYEDNLAAKGPDLKIGNDHELLFGLWLPNLIWHFGTLTVFALSSKRLRPTYAAWFIAYFAIAIGTTWLLSGPRYLLAMPVESFSISQA